MCANAMRKEINCVLRNFSQFNEIENLNILEVEINSEKNLNCCNIFYLSQQFVYAHFFYLQQATSRENFCVKNKCSVANFRAVTRTCARLTTYKVK